MGKRKLENQDTSPVKKNVAVEQTPLKQRTLSEYKKGVATSLSLDSAQLNASTIVIDAESDDDAFSTSSPTFDSLTGDKRRKSGDDVTDSDANVSYGQVQSIQLAHNHAAIYNIRPPTFDLHSFLLKVDPTVILRPPDLDLALYKAYMTSSGRKALYYYLLSELPWYRVRYMVRGVKLFSRFLKLLFCAFFLPRYRPVVALNAGIID